MPDELAQLEARIDRALRRDQFGLRQLARRIRAARKAGKPHDRNLRKLADLLDDSERRRAARADAVPKITYPADLPISAKVGDIQQAIRENQVVVVCGETGSGKSTQLPKILLEMGYGVSGLIGHTQPRRIAARTIGQRIAREMAVPLGQQVGFKIRFADQTADQTMVKLMTDGILLAETQSDRYLDAYEAIIIDEAHERSLNIDFLMGYLHQLLQRRPDLKLIITSATIDTERFAAHFGTVKADAPVIEVSGRTYPVEVRYRPLETGDDEGEPDTTGSGEVIIDDDALHRGLRRAVDELRKHGPGDMLIFMPTERAISEAAKMLRGHVTGAEVLPLYARLPQSEQTKIFEPGGVRRIVIATNVAESSVTVPRIHYVIDTGTARVSRYSARSRLQRLPIEAISQASAEQRKGRCGRIGPGVCIRLYSEESFLSREHFAQPEIQRTNLASVILQLRSLGFGSVEQFPLLDPPKPGMVREGYQTLRELHAIGEDHQLTPIGRRLAKMPTDPRIARMIYAGHEQNCLNEVLIIASALEIQDPRERPLGKEAAADEAHAQFNVPDSDFMGLLKLWDFYHGLKQKLSRGQLRKACKQNFLHFARCREWTEIHRQLVDLCRQERLKLSPRADAHEPIHRALLSGLLSNIALKTGKYEYTGGGGKKLYLWPGSAVFAAKPQWIVAAEVVETTQRYARVVGRINPVDIEPVAGDLATRTYSEPTWNPDRGLASAQEKVSLFGLTVVPRRTVPLHRVDPQQARQMFIHQGLVEMDWANPPEFLEANRKLIAEIEEEEAKRRQRDLLADQEARYAFYDKRLPAEVVSGPTLRKWWKRAQRHDPKLLNMQREHVLADADKLTDAGAFPKALEAGGVKMPLSYELAPGASEDGVTLTVPLFALSHISEQQMDWLVPGRLVEKITALIRSMPKQVRKNYVPAPQVAEQAAEHMTFGEGEFLEAVAAALGKVTTLRPSVENFDLSKLDEHLRMNLRVVDAKGAELATGRELGPIRAELGSKAAAAMTKLSDASFRKEGLTKWDFGPLAEQAEVKAGGATLVGYPALEDAGQSVTLTLRASREEAERVSRQGVLRLALLQVHGELKYRVEQSPAYEKLLLAWSTLGSAAGLREQLCDLAGRRAFMEEADLPRDAEAFEDMLNRGWNRIADAADEAIALGERILAAYHPARLALDDAKQRNWPEAAEQGEIQLRLLMADGFLTHTPWQWLVQYSRYLRGLSKRLEKLRVRGGADRDRKLAIQFEERWRKYVQKAKQAAEEHRTDEALETYRWMLEEWRVSLFAQEIGTSIPVSEKRLDRQWKKIG